MSGSLYQGPYIPESHEKYGLLPHCKRKGGEVFSYPSWLNELDGLLSESGLFDGGEEASKRTMILIPHGYSSYAEYRRKLKQCADRCKDADSELAESIVALAREMDRLNVKENWSVLRYTGDQFDDAPQLTALTKGRCYYWPCSKENPVYEGVIDDEEFTSYLYPCDPDSWEILEDPTGMAARALSGEADTVSFWRFDEQEGAPFADMIERGVMPKMMRGAPAFFDEEDAFWGRSERDLVSFRCPECGNAVDLLAWTKLNGQDSPEAFALLLEDRLSEFHCLQCGYTASLFHPCLLLDPDSRTCIYHVADERMASMVSDMFDSFREDPSCECGRFRIVGSRFQLAEKARLFSAGLDDRAVEVLKLGIAGSARLEDLASPDEEVSIICKTVTDDGSLDFSIELGGGRFTTRMPKDAYLLFADAIDRSSLADEQPYRVDSAWAREAVGVLQEEGL